MHAVLMEELLFSVAASSGAVGHRQVSGVHSFCGSPARTTGTSTASTAFTAGGEGWGGVGGVGWGGGVAEFVRV